MYNAVLLSLVALSPLLLQTQTSTQTTLGDPVGDLAKLVGAVIAAWATKYLYGKLNDIRKDLASYREASRSNTESVKVINESVSGIDTRVHQLETDLSKAILERNEAQARVITVQAAADAAHEYSSAQIKHLEDKNRVLNSDLIMERVINAELAGNIRDLRSKMLKQDQRIEQLESAGLIADAIAREVVKINSAT